MRAIWRHNRAWIDYEAADKMDKPQMLNLLRQHITG